MAEQNPYQSPTADPADDETPIPNQPQLDRRRPLLMSFLGALIGVLTTAVCGGLGAGLLGVVADQILLEISPAGPWNGFSVTFGEFAFFGAVLGTIYGGFLGLLIGVVIGLTSGLVSDPESRLPIYVAAILSAIGGGTVGAFGGGIVGSDQGSTLPLWLLGGALIGTAAGILGGTFMGISLRMINQKLRRRISD